MPIWKTNSTCSKAQGLKNTTPLGKNLLFSEAPYKFNGKMKDPETGNYYYGARYYNPKWSIWLSVDPLAHKYPSMSPYAYTLWNPVKYVDPDGRSVVNPIYDKCGNFLGTDDQGLQGEAIVMNKSDFTQGMSHEVAMSKNLGIKGLSSYAAASKLSRHYINLPSRPDSDGFLTIPEGIAWAKSHPDALENPTPNNTLYINSAKLNFGGLSTSDFPTTNQKTAVNLLNFENAILSTGNKKVRATSYALGRVNMILTNRSSRSVKIINDKATVYDWNTGGSFIRRHLINFERNRANINDSHGFKIFYYGTGTLNKPFTPNFNKGYTW